jgi:hypothetical protein
LFDADWRLKEDETWGEQARHTCVNGLLASNPPALDDLRIAGQRLLQDALESLEAEGEVG